MIAPPSLAVDAVVADRGDGGADSWALCQGRSRLSIRLMVGLLYLKHAFNESDAHWTSCGSLRPLRSREGCGHYFYPY
jgi:hypothetical protein